MTITTAEEVNLAPLSAEEQATLNQLLARESADKGPASRAGEPYEALVCLSVPRRGDKDKLTDLVYPGETVYLTDDEARRFLRQDPGRDGRQAPAIRKLSGPDGSREPLPRVLPRMMSGRMFRPTMPAPGTDGPRPDPAGSSKIQVLENGAAPEADGATAVDPAEVADQLKAQEPDAVDIPPRGTRSRQGR